MNKYIINSFTKWDNIIDVIQQFAFFQLAINIDIFPHSLFFFFLLIFKTYVIGGFTMIHLTIPVLKIYFKMHTKYYFI